MRDQILDYMNAFLGAFFILIGAVAIPEIRRSKKYVIICAVLILFMIILGVDKINRDKADKTSFVSKIDTISKKLTSIQVSKTNDSLQRLKEIGKNEEFQKRLFKEFKITRDSQNRPVEINTTIRNAKDVYIGPKE
jgi:hypothetical protein